MLVASLRGRRLIMIRHYTLCCLFAAFCPALLPAAALLPQKLVWIPSQPGQQISSMQIDPQGNLIVAALVTLPDISENFPFIVDYHTSTFGLIKKIDPQGNEIFSRFLPAADAFQPLALALDAKGDVYAGGYTDKPDNFPYTNILYTPNVVAGQGAGFLIKLNGADGTLLYAAELGGNPTSIIVDASGQALFTMSAAAYANVPTTPGAYSTGGGYLLAIQMYIVRLSAGGDNILLSSLYFGGAPVCNQPSQCLGIDEEAFTSGSQIVTDSQGNIWVAGSTNGTALPTTSNALQGHCGCGQSADGSLQGDGFLAEFSGDGSKLLYATYFGTSPSGPLSNDGDDSIAAAAMDSGGHIWFVGSTSGSGLVVTPNAIQSQLAGGYDGFLADYDPATNKLLYVTYFGGAGGDSITNIQIAADGTVLFTGHTASSKLPVAASGFTRGPDFLATLDPQTYSVNYLTTFAAGSTGTGLTTAPGGSKVISGTGNVATFLQPGGPTPSLYSVTNAASFGATGQIAAGELITLFGSGIGPATPATADLSGGAAPMQLGGVQVLLDASPIPLLYAQQDQINAIVPFVVGKGPLHVLKITNSAAASNPASLGVIDADPAPFSSNPPYAAALNQDGTVNSQSNPASQGSTVSVFATGFGQLLGSPNSGAVITSATGAELPVQVFYNGQPLNVTYAGQAPMLVGGVSQVNFMLPAAIISPIWTLQFNAGGWPSAPFKIWVK